MTKITSALRRMFQIEHGKAWLMGTIAVLVALLAIQGGRYYLIGRFEKRLMASLEEGVQGPPKRNATKPQEDYNPIAEKGIFGPVKKPPTHSLWGILGDEALFGTSADAAKPFKVGGKLPSGEEIVRMGINDVVLAKDGKERTVYVHDALKPAGASKPSPAGPPSPAPAKTDEAGPAGTDVTEESKEPPSDAADVKNHGTAPQAAASDETKAQAAVEVAEKAVREAAKAARLKAMEARER